MSNRRLTPRERARVWVVVLTVFMVGFLCAGLILPAFILVFFILAFAHTSRES